MKTSKYNICIQEKGNYYVYNQLSGAIDQVDKELYALLEASEYDLNSLDKDLMETLKGKMYICDDDLIEENIILKNSKERRFGGHHARITILPTINCNFNCWYCYETHEDSRMGEQDREAVISFIKKIVGANNIQQLHLDWFGGEPLMYFDEIMYPISIAVQELCKKNNIFFSNTITTNGYFINSEMIEKMQEINLTSFQITLDGARKFHNLTRFSREEKNSYDVIVNNIVLLCRSIQNIDMDVRINYTPKNIHTMEQIADSFPEDVRGKISVTPQIVWQFKDRVNGITDIIKDKLFIFSKKGYRIVDSINLSIEKGCYVENMLQFVINYNMKVFKCTARDYSDDRFSVGRIDSDGNFIPNANYYNYFVSSHFENEKCLACKLLPSCCGMCLQKKVEGSIPLCPYNSIEASLINKLKLVIERIEDKSKE